MLELHIIIFILISHWVADFILQTDEIAKNKSKSNLVLLTHGLLYISVFLLSGIILFQDIILTYILWVLVNGILHICTDYVTSRITSKLYAKGDIHNFFVVIGLDQMIHMIHMFVTWYLIIGS